MDIAVCGPAKPEFLTALTSDKYMIGVKINSKNTNDIGKIRYRTASAAASLLFISLTPFPDRLIGSSSILLASDEDPHSGGLLGY